MRFLSPYSLIWFLPFAAAIIVLYLLKLKRKEQMVSSVMLWQDAVADIQANAPFQKLKKSLLLLLQLIALFALVFGIARPYIRAKGMSENKIVIILDSSASMQSTDISPSRFDNAKSKALEVVNRMGSDDTMLVITAGAKTRVVASFTSDKKSLQSAISALKPVDAPCNMRQAMVLALSLVAGKSASPPRIVLLSDGLFSSLSDLSPGSANLTFIKIGARCDNVAITSLDSRKTLSGDQQVFVSLRNFSDKQRVFNLELYMQDQLIDIREETLRPGEAKQEILENVKDASGRVTAKLDIEDDLIADNSGSVYLAKRGKLSVLMVSKGNLFLQNALNLDPRTQLIRSESIPADFANQKYNLVVFDCIAPPANLPPGGYLLLRTSAAQGPATIGAAVDRPTVIDYARNHPVSAYVDFNEVRIAQANYLQPKPWATTIVEGPGGGLGVAGSNGGRKFVQLSFDILESDFPLHVGFPIFIANCLDWLVPTSATAPGDSIRTSQPMYIASRLPSKRLT
ncbi:MAG: BatA and WFA domain-containing protein [Armatimonadetes bacterium]|nr:BatA and WFA domain-containing protein [Armatimonadota bacterium]